MLWPAVAHGDSHFGPPTVPEGFRVEPVITQVHHPTRLAWGPDGRLYIAQQTGEIIAVKLEGGREVARDQVARAKLHLLGITLKGDKLWVSDTGAIAVYTRTPEGRYANRQEILSNVPHGLHQNDGFAWGPDGKLYWGLGSTKDRGPETHPWSGSIMRMNPDGTGVEVFARGFRNPYGIAFDPAGNLWVTDNGADDPVSSDELNLVVQGGDYGYPRVFEMPPAGSPTKAPLALFGDHNSTNGLTVYTGNRFPKRYRGGLFVAMWGSSFDDQVGRAVGFVELTKQGAGYKANVTEFASGFNRPLDVIAGPDGDLWVADFVAGTIYRIWYDGPAETEPDSHNPGLDPQQPVSDPGVEPGEPARAGATLPSWAWSSGAVLILLLGAGAIFLRRKG